MEKTQHELFLHTAQNGGPERQSLSIIKIYTQLIYHSSNPAKAAKYQHKDQVQMEYYNTHTIQMEFKFHLKTKKICLSTKFHIKAAQKLQRETKIPTFCPN